MIVVTGAAGFIGSTLVKRLNEDNFNDILAVDEFPQKRQYNYLNGLSISKMLDRDIFLNWFSETTTQIAFIFHLGAITDTTETNENLLNQYNTEYTKIIWRICVQKQIPLVYASSAATYGDGSYGFSDNPDMLSKLQPLNAYGWSKHKFDLWAVAQERTPIFWAGLKFFNVYGENEGNKGKMASMHYQMKKQASANGKVKLFKSYKPEYKDGGQKRDFVPVDMVTSSMLQLMRNRDPSGIRNVGTGKARSFNDLALEIFNSLKMKPQIEYIDIPDGIRDSYQYFTEAPA